MARLVILGAGIAGQTAALHARRKLGRDHEVVAVSPDSEWNWIPSNIRVGVGVMTPGQVTFPLRPVYEKTGIAFVQGKAVSVHPEGDGDAGKPYVTVELTEPGRAGREERVPYDWLVAATGPKLNFDATPGLGPQKNSVSVCTFDHAAHASRAFDESDGRTSCQACNRVLFSTIHDCTPGTHFSRPLSPVLRALYIGTSSQPPFSTWRAAISAGSGWAK